ncbi:hypothetical protein OAE85_01930 [Akkermansiaceae bacterium]|nr:hypothetical protein [Akkermansiaceae bacterium]|tara:strand:- start:1014 stop:1289 length:276 start_codon:yes stop_codon:yes gene_type:complete
MKISIVMGFSSSMDEIIKSDGGVGLPILVDVSMAVLKEHESGGFGGFVLAGGVMILLANRVLIAITEAFILVRRWLDETKGASSSKATNPV